MKILLISTLLIGEFLCNTPTTDNRSVKGNTLQSINDTPAAKPTAPAQPIILSTTEINTANTQPSELIAFAKTLIGIPYLYGSTDPAKGFDCSGFITHVFK